MLVSGDKESKQVFIFPSSIEKCTTCGSEPRSERMHSIPRPER